MYAFVEGRRIVKIIQICEAKGKEVYREYGVDQMLSEDGTKILPKTEKGKPQNFTAPNLEKKTPVGMAFYYSLGSVNICNNSADQEYYYSRYASVEIDGFEDLSLWVTEWCRRTGEAELAEINAFAKQAKVHQKFKEGDFFRYRIDRGLYGYGRILVDYAKMRKDGIRFWNIFMGKPLCVAVYHIATDNADLTPSELVGLKMLPSQMIMDNVFFYGECKIIGHLPIAADEDNYTVHYGRSLDRRTNIIYYQCGKTFAHRDDGVLLEGGFRNSGIGFFLDVKLNILLACIRENSNTPYWEMITPARAAADLRNPAFKEKLKKIKEHMSVQ